MASLKFSRGRKLPVILQAEKAECALACLAMILGYHGHRIDINTLRNTGDYSSRGLGLKSVMALADKFHLAPRPLRLEPEDLGRLQLPAILHWDMGHFVVLKNVGARGVVIHDPSVGELRRDHKTLARHFTGVALELTPTAAFSPGNNAKKLRLRDLWSRSEGLAGGLVQLFILSILLQLFSLAMPFYTQLFIDDVLVNRDVDLLKSLAVGFALITVIKCITQWLRAHVVLHMSNRVSFQFAVNVFRHLMRLPLDFFSSRHMGDIVSRFGSLNNVRDFLCSGLVEVVIDGVMVIGTLALMFVYSRQLTLVALIAVAAYALLRLSLYRAYYTGNEELLNNRANENSQFMESIHAIQGIKLFGKESDRIAGWQNYYADVINAGIKVQKLGITANVAHSLLVGAENIVLVLLGGFAVLNNQISVGMIVAYLGFKDQFYNRVFDFMDKVFEFRLLDVHLTRLADIAMQSPEKHVNGADLPAGHKAVRDDALLRADNLCFRYGRDMPPLFREVSLRVEREETVTIIGPTGCGKSTLLRVLLGLLKSEAGVISMHGVPIHAMGLAAYREKVAAVLQDDCLLSGSILDNITFFDPSPDRARVEHVAELAAIAGDITVLPMQYNTLVGGIGTTLSGGQVQRLLLARALYRRPELLVLDEATSHLDLDAEKAVNDALRETGSTRIMVAHRPDTILRADRILCLKPDGLMAVSRDEIREMARRQSRGDITVS